MMNVYFEIGNKRTFACAVDWLGWSRSGSDESSALQTLLDYAPRYARVVARAGIEAELPREIARLTIVERLKGNAGTDFGAPSVAPAADDLPVSEADLQRLHSLLGAVWDTLDEAVLAAQGKALRTGPRGGGRSLEKIVQHAFDADLAYLNRLGGKFKPGELQADPRLSFAPLRQVILETLGPAARGELPLVGPRGGKRWTARYYVRYAAWHMLDHAWEIEDRLLPED